MVLSSVALLLLCQLAGEFFVVLLGLPVPGPVVGLVLLLVGLLLRGEVPQGLGRVVDALLANLSLLFVPAGVGVMLHVAIVSDEWLAITAALIGSTVLAIAVTALVMGGLTRWLERRRTG